MNDKDLFGEFGDLDDLLLGSGSGPNDFMKKLEALKSIEDILNTCEREKRQLTRDELSKVTSYTFDLMPKNTFFSLPDTPDDILETILNSSKRAENCLVLKNKKSGKIELCFLE